MVSEKGANERKITVECERLQHTQTHPQIVYPTCNVFNILCTVVLICNHIYSSISVINNRLECFQYRYRVPGKYLNISARIYTEKKIILQNQDNRLS